MYFFLQVFCGGEGDGSNLVCGLVVFFFVNFFYFFFVRVIFFVFDGYIKILDYEGRIKLVMIFVDNLLMFFVVIVFVLFFDGEISNLNFNLMMMYDEYKDMFYEYSGFQRKVGELI